MGPYDGHTDLTFEKKHGHGRTDLTMKKKHGRTRTSPRTSVAISSPAPLLPPEFAPKLAVEVHRPTWGLPTLADSQSAAYRLTFSFLTICATATLSSSAYPAGLFLCFFHFCTWLYMYCIPITTTYGSWGLGSQFPCTGFLSARAIKDFHLGHSKNR